MTRPADEPHGTTHFALAYALAAHLAEGHAGAVDMLTRTSEDSDFAPDASIYPAARDPETGRRQLEELAFEIVSEQWIGVPTEKARELAGRGVRRIFCIVVKKGRVLEWSRETDGWQMLADGASIDDRCLARPLPIRALLDAAAADRAVVAALRDRGALREIEEERRCEGFEQGSRDALRQHARDLCELLGIDLDDARRRHVDELDAAGLRDLVAELKRQRRWPGA